MPTFSQSKIVGFVYDADSGKPLEGANLIVLKTSLGSAANSEGIFRIFNLKPGKHRVKATYMGYKDKILTVTLKTNQTIQLTFRLKSTPIPLREVVVTPGYFSVSRKVPSMRQTLNRTELIKIAPVVEDVYRSVQHLPGVVGDDFAAKFAVRGGAPSEVLVMFDGLEMIEPLHLRDISGGVMSIIDLESISSIDLLTGGFTADYGNKLSGIFSIRSHQKPVKPHRTVLGISLLNARFFTEHEFADGKGMWMFSGRRGFYDYIMKAMQQTKQFLPKFWDTFLKVQYAPKENHIFAGKFLASGDVFKYRDEWENKASNSYGNLYGWMNYSGEFWSRLSIKAMAAIGQVKYRRKADLVNHQGEYVNQTHINEDKLSFTDFKINTSLDIFSWMALRAGIQQRDLKMDYFYSAKEWKYDDNLNLIGSNLRLPIELHPASIHLSGYISQRLRIFKNFITEVGVRYDSHSHTGDSDWTPRVNMALKLGDYTVIKAGWGKFTQAHALHELKILDSETKFYPREVSEHKMLGIEHTFLNGLHVRVDAYLKKHSDLRRRYFNLFGTLDIFPELSGDRHREEATSGFAKGIELYMKHIVNEKFSWYLGYCLSSAKDLILIKEIRREFDQTHTLDLSGVYRPSGNWQFNASWIFHTGRPYTGMDLKIGPTMTPDVFYGEASAHRLRSDTYPNYHRMDIRVSRSLKFNWSELKLYVEIINLYNHKNIRNYDYVVENNPSENPTLKTTEDHWLPFMPSFGVGMNWEW